MIDSTRNKTFVHGMALGAGIALWTGFGATAAAQGLPTVTGITELQKPVATAVQSLCMAITDPNGPYNVTPNANGTPVQRLANTCSLMVVTAFAQQGAAVPDQFNLKISPDALNKGTQAIAPVQMNAQKQISVEASKANTIGARLLDLRGGSRGFVVGGNGQPASTVAANSQTGFARGTTGGGAAADDLGGGPWGGFANIAYSWGNVDQTTLQDSYSYGSFSIFAGADYRVNDKAVVGGALFYSDTHSDYDQSLGEITARTFGVAFYGTYFVDDWYVDGLVSFGSVDYDSTRNINIPSNNQPIAPPIITSATSSPKGDQWSLGFGVGRNFNYQSTIVTPFARLGYIWVKNKSFTEYEPNAGLGLAVDERTVTSLQSALGARVSTVVNTSSGVFTPYLSAAWMHEFENDNPSIISKYVADPTNTFFAIPTATPTRDYAVILAGSSATFANNFSGFFQFSAALGLANETNYGVVLGLRKQF